MERSTYCAILVGFIFSATVQAQDEFDCNLVPVVVGCDGLQCQIIKAGPQEYNAGQVCVGIDGNDLKFYFTAADGWDFKNIQLWVGESLDGVPQDANGCPDVDSFPYDSDDITGDREHTACYPLQYLEFICSEEDQKYYVVAHADVNSSVFGCLSSWSGNIEICSEGGGVAGDVDPDDYTGTITWDNGDGGLTGLTDANNINVWLNDNTYLSWEVTDNNDGTWTYKYVLDVNDQKDISHFILEVSESFEEENYVSGPDHAGLDTYGTGSSNPGIPGSMKGIKWEDQNDTHWELTFDSNKAPTWGDFYTVDGKKSGETPAIWNVGFTNPDDDNPETTDNGEWDHIVVPDTNSTPGPVTKAYAYKIRISCNCEGHVDCSESDIEIDPNDIIKILNDPNTRWSDGTIHYNPHYNINNDPNVTPTDDVIYDANYTIFLDLCPCDVSTYPAYQSSNTPTSALLRGALVDDGGDVCRTGFVYWPQGGTPVITPWSDAIYETGDVFSWMLDNLEPDTTYFYQALAKNSVSQAVGSVKSFTTPSF